MVRLIPTPSSPSPLPSSTGLKTTPENDVINLIISSDSSSTEDEVRSPCNIQDPPDPEETESGDKVKTMEDPKLQKSLKEKLEKIEKLVKRKRENLEDTPMMATEPRAGPSSQYPPSNPELIRCQQKLQECDQDLLKRKLELVSNELSKSRVEQMEQAKKLRKGRRVREQAVIEIPDFPMEFYNRTTIYSDLHVNPQSWFPLFNSYVILYDKKGEYSRWIQNRVASYLPMVLKVMCNVWKENSPASLQLTGSDLLRCRLVNKSWKQHVDKFLEEQSGSIFLNNSDNASVSTRISSSGNLQFTAFLSSLGKIRSRNPFPSRSLVISDFLPAAADASDIRFELQGLSWKLLSWYGDHVRCFSYLSSQGNYNERRFFNDTEGNCWRTLLFWLEFMPNLRSVRISLPRDTDTTSEDHRGVFWRISVGPFPKLTNLTKMESRHLPNSFINSALDANPQIQHLSLCPIPEEKEISEDVFGHLAKLNLSEFSLNVSNVLQFDILKLIHGPLRKLTVISTNDVAIDIDTLFESLEKFQGTSTDLRLDVGVKSSPGKTPSLKLPRLQNLYLCLREIGIGEALCYDFLLPLTSLQTLEIGNWEATDILSGDPETTNGTVQVIQLEGYVGHLYESNIWKLFPNLKRATITTRENGESFPSREYKYTRDRLEK